MRKIKFRAFHYLTKEIIDSDEVENRYLGKNPIEWHNERKWTLMQFTGLIDKNGVEIYEGDYLIDLYPIDEENLSLGYNESLLPVVWCKEKLTWCVDVSFKKDGSYLTSLVDYFGGSLEVKGNIYQSKQS